MSQDTIAPLVSVIIPTFNRAQFLGRTLESALAQTHSHLEVLVMDDGSADDTPNVVARYQEQDARIRYVRHPENLGLVRNWKAGIAAATGSFFCILGDDDSLEPTFVEELLAPLQADPNLVLSFCDHWIMDHAGTRLLERSRENTSYWRRDQLRRGALTDFFRIALIDRAIFIGATLFRRDFVDPGFLEDEASAFVDVWMLYHCGQQGEGYYVPARLCTCRWQPGGVSRSWKWRMYGFPGEIHCYRHFLHDPALQKYADIFRVRLSHSLTTYGNTLLSLGHTQQARASLREAIQLHALWRARAGYALTHLGPVGTLASRWLRQVRRSLPTRSDVPNYPEKGVLDLSPSGKEQMNTRTVSSAAPPVYSDPAIPVS